MEGVLRRYFHSLLSCEYIALKVPHLVVSEHVKPFISFYACVHIVVVVKLELCLLLMAGQQADAFVRRVDAFKLCLDEHVELKVKLMAPISYQLCL